MSSNKKYWLVIDSWNLLESFTTESVSPYSFYEDRGFGNTLSRNITKGSDTINHLILTSFEPASDYAIEISSDILETSLIEISKTNNNIISYPKTIYYSNGKVRFRFSSEEIKIGFIVESKILFEVKCVEKYLNSFYVDKKTIEKLEINFPSNFSYERDKYVHHDIIINFAKGSLLGFAYGQLTSMNSNQRNLLLFITDLKNSFTGLHTTLMIGDDPITDLSCQQKIEICKHEYNKQNLETTNLFEILSQVFQEVIKLGSLRSSELKKQKTPQYLIELKDLKNKREDFQRKIYKLEDEHEVNKIYTELDSIKQSEVSNGKKKGKARIYFTKNSPEYKRKQELKDIIKKFEDENNEYKELKKEIIEIEGRISNYRFGNSEYDSTLGALFVRLSDGTNDLLKKINKIDNDKSVNFSNIQIINNEFRFINDGFCSEEIEYLNIVLNYILSNHSKGTRVLSENEILNIIIETGKIYKQTSSYETNIKTDILKVLREYWSYKNNKTKTFDIPNNLPILQAIMSFYLKAQGFDQIERFMLNRKYQHKEFAFLLWGAYVGFASIPKTFTKIIFENKNPLIIEYIENYLFENVINIEI
jgi:hypothetical protein